MENTSINRLRMVNYAVNEADGTDLFNSDPSDVELLEMDDEDGDVGGDGEQRERGQ